MSQTPIPIPALDPNPDRRGLSLRDWDLDGAAVVLAAGRDPVASRYRYSLPRSAEAAQGWIEQVSRDRSEGARLELAITEHDVVVGSVSLTDLEHGNAMIR